MLPYRDSRITVFILIIFFILVIGYGYYEARGILFGPKITVTSSLEEQHESYITIEGHADRIADLSMNGHSVAVTENGEFSEPYLLAPGLNQIFLDAHDKYGRTSERVIQIVYIPSSTSTPDVPATTTIEVSATSTSTTSSEVAPER